MIKYTSFIRKTPSKISETHIYYRKTHGDFIFFGFYV